ncbi:MAG: ThuA domain-containing protein [Balneolales bacterium]
MRITLLCATLFLIPVWTGPSALPAEASSADEPKRLVLVAGKASHSTGTHEHRAGVLLMQRCLAGVEELEVNTVFEGWPADKTLFDSADAILMFMDGGGNHPAVQQNRLELLQKYINEGTGFGAMHYGVEVPADNGGEEFKQWIGGHYETHFSVNPIWEATFDNLPDHPILRGVQPFSVRDEWYFSIRFRPGMVGITPLLVTAPTDETRDGPYVNPKGPYDHIVHAKGQSEVMSWIVDRKDGGRGFGFTGGHFHENWGNENFRKYVLNALVWLSGLDVPEAGVTCQVTGADIQENLDR